MEMFGIPLDPEEQERQRQAHEKAKMAWEDFSNRFTAMVTEELTFEQLQTLAGLMSVLSNSNDAHALASFYEGICAAALAVRHLRLGEGENEELKTLLSSNDPRSHQ